MKNYTIPQHYIINISFYHQQFSVLNNSVHENPNTFFIFIFLNKILHVNYQITFRNVFLISTSTRILCNKNKNFININLIFLNKKKYLDIHSPRRINFLLPFCPKACNIFFYISLFSFSFFRFFFSCIILFSSRSILFSTYTHQNVLLSFLSFYDKPYLNLKSFQTVAEGFSFLVPPNL